MKSLESQSNKSLLSRFKLSKEPSKAAPYLRAILAFVTELPGVGHLLKGTTAALKELAKAEDDQQLEQRLLSIGLQTHEDIAALTYMAQIVYLQQSTLLSLLEGEGLITQKEELTEIAFETALIAYRSNLAQDYQYADHRGIEGAARAIQTSSLPLDDIYVLPSLLTGSEQTSITDKEKRLLESILHNRDLSTEQRVLLEEQFATLTAKRWHLSSRDHEVKGLSLGKALERFRQIVVIGGPGIGKSLLTRYLGRTCALGLETMRERLDWAEDLIPVVIPLAAYADAQSKNPGLTIRDYLDESMSIRGGDVLCDAISARLAAGKVFVMLDGVDEVPNSRKRAALVQAVEVFISQHRSNRFLITSRPYGYIPITGEVTHLQLPNFSSSQVDNFVIRWQLAIERKQHPDAPNLDAANSEADNILKEIRRNRKISELATNPLMLVIISLIRQERTRLPEERVQLYHCAVNTLMDTWNQWRSALGYPVGGEELPLNRLIPVWGAIAEWTHRNKPTGIMHRAELRRELIRILIEREFDEDHPEETADSYLNAAAHRAGLVEERGPDIYAFWHPTFEEYLAAIDIAIPGSKAVDRLLPLRDDSHWREVLLLAVGYVGIIQHDEGTATEIVQAIADRGLSPFEPLFHSALRMAAACIAEDVGVKRTLAQQIISRMARALQGQHSNKLKDSFTSTIWALHRLRPASETISALAPIIEGNYYDEKAAAVRLLINVLDDPRARALCEQALNDRYRWVSFGAAAGLAGQGDYRPEVWKALAGVGNGFMLTPGFFAEYEHVWEGDHTRLLGQQKNYIATAPKEALDNLRTSLYSDDLLLRVAAAWLLHTKESEREAAVNALIGCLSSPSLNIRFEAARMLLQLGSADKQAEEALTICAAEADPDLCFDAVGVLILKDRVNERVKNKLYAWLVSENHWLAMWAVNLLRHAGLGDAELIERLFSWLDSENEAYMDIALHHLFGPSITQRPIGDRFKVWLVDKGLSSGSLHTRYVSGRWLVELGYKGEALTKSLQTLLVTEYSSSALNDLKRLGFQSESFANEILACLQSDSQSYDTKFSVATELCRLGHTELAIETVIKWIDPHAWASLAALEKVIKKEPLSEDDSHTLVGLISLRDEDTELQQKARSWLFNWLEEHLDPQNS